MVEKDRIQTEHVQVTTTAANVWTSDISEYKVRYILAIHLTGDGTNNSRVTISKVEEDDTTTTKIVAYVTATGNYDLPGTGPDPDRPILVLEGGTNLQVASDVGTPDLTIWYVDSEE